MEKKIYKSPTLKVVEFKAEQGFAGSFTKQDGNFISTFEADEGARAEAFDYTIYDENTNSFWN